MRIAPSAFRGCRRSCLLTSTLVCLVPVLVAYASGQASDAPKASPRGITQMAFADGKKVTIEYGRPSRNGHPVFGSRVPFEQVWAAGDGLATSLVTQKELRLTEGSIQRGKFSLYLLPSQTQWLHP